MSKKVASSGQGFTVSLMLAVALIFIGGAIEGPTWAKLGLIVAGVLVIVIGAFRRSSHDTASKDRAAGG